MNQDGTTEVTKQIYLIDEVFGMAKQVCEWLGDDPTRFAIIKRILTKIEPDLARVNTRLLKDGKSKEDSYALLSRFDEMQITSPYWVDLWVSYFLYFQTRLWAFQEVILAQRLLIFCQNDIGKS